MAGTIGSRPAASPSGGGAGKSAKQIAIDAGQLPANTTDAQFVAFLRGLNPRGAWAAATVYAVNDTFTQGGSTYRVTANHTSPASFTFDTTKMELLAAAGSVGKPGNYIGANPAATGPVLIIQGGGYVAAAPSMLASLTAQLYLKGTDGLYADGLVPYVWPAGVSAGYRMILQAQTSGTNILWLAPGAQIPSTLGTGDAAFVELGTAGAVQDTVVWKKGAVYFDNSAIKTSDRFLAATYANVAAFDAVYTKVGTFSTYLYDQAGTPVSGRELQLDPGGTSSRYRYLRSSYPTGSATFPDGSIVVFGQKGGNTDVLVAMLRASGTTPATLGGVEARLNTNNGTLSLWTLVNGAETQVGVSVAKGATNDTYYGMRLAVSGTSVKVRSWLASGAEPTTWDIDTTQSTVNASGLAGFGDNISYGKFSFMGVSRGDALAPVS